MKLILKQTMRSWLEVTLEVIKISIAANQI